MGTVGHDPASVEEHDAIGQADGREPVGDDQCGPALHEHAQGGVDALLHLDVDCARCIVEDQDGRVDQQGSGDGDALTLPARERVPPFADHRVVSLGEAIDETGRTGRLGGGHHLLHGGVGPAVSDVVPDRHREEEWLIENDADVAPQAGQGEVAHVVTIDLHRAVGGVVEASQHAGDARLPAARPPDQRHGLARVQVQVEVAQDVAPTVVLVARLGQEAVGRVGEGDIVELNVSPGVDQVDGVGSIDDRRLLVDDLVDALGRGRGTLAHHDEHPEHHEGGLHHDQVQVEGDDGGDRQVVVNDHPAADQEDQYESHLGEVLHQGSEAGAQVGILDVAPLHPVGGGGQLAELLLLGGETAHDAHPVHVLVHHGGDLGQARLDEPRHREERLAHFDADQVDERHGNHGHEGQGHADGEHEAEGHDGDRALHEDHRCESQVHLDRADIGVRPGDQLPGLHAVVEGKRHPREVLVEDVAQVEFDGVGHLEEIVPRDVAEKSGEQGQHADELHIGVQRMGAQDQRVGDPVLEDQRDPDLNDQTQEGEQQRAEELHLVRHDDWRGALDPRLGTIRIDGRLGRLVAAHGTHGHVGSQRQASGRFSR